MAPSYFDQIIALKTFQLANDSLETEELNLLLQEETNAHESLHVFWRSYFHIPIPASNCFT